MARYRVTRTAQEVLEVDAEDYRDALDQALDWCNENQWEVVNPGYLVDSYRRREGAESIKRMRYPEDDYELRSRFVGGWTPEEAS